MYHLMRNLPVFGTLGVVALLAGPLARLPIDLGAWLLDLLLRWICRTGSRDRRCWCIPVVGRPAGTRGQSDRPRPPRTKGQGSRRRGEP